MRQRRLGDGDVVRAGSTLMRFRQPRGVVGDTTAVAVGSTELRITDAERRLLVSLCRPMLRSADGVPAPNADIADELTLSLPAVKSHVRTLFTKVGVADLSPSHKRLELARRAIEAGLVSARDL